VLKRPAGIADRADVHKADFQRFLGLRGGRRSQRDAQAAIATTVMQRGRGIIVILLEAGRVELAIGDSI
jgi:hypothetical protein